MGVQDGGSVGDDVKEGGLQETEIASGAVDDGGGEVVLQALAFQHGELHHAPPHLVPLERRAAAAVSLDGISRLGLSVPFATGARATRVSSWYHVG